MDSTFHSDLIPSFKDLSIANILMIFGLVISIVVIWLFLSKKEGKNENEVSRKIQHVGFQLFKVVYLIVSLLFITSLLGLHIMDILNVPIMKIGEKFSINGFLLLFVLFTVYVFVVMNRLLNNLSNKIGYLRYIPPKVFKSIRRWLSIIVALILIRGVISLTDHSFELFSIFLFSIRDTPITIGVIIQGIFISYTVYVFLSLGEHFFNLRVRKKGIDIGKSKTIFQIVQYFVWVFAIIFIFSSFGLSLNVLIAGSAALFVGLGFGIQSLFNDFVSGLLILFEGTIRVQDVVEIEDGIIGKVQEIGLRTSKILTRDNIIMIIPNNNFVGKNVINWSYNDHKTRFKVDVGVAYGSDVRLVEKILVKCALDHEKIYREPAPFVHFNEFGDSSLNFSLFFWIEESFLVERVRSDLRFAIDYAFRENGVEIPFPQRDIHIRSGLDIK